MRTLTERDLNRATLARQLLLRRERLGVVEAVHRVCALQAQEPASPYVALWNRVEGFAADDLDTAFAAHDVVKATLMRLTLHAVAAADYPVAHGALSGLLRGYRTGAPRFAATGLTDAEVHALFDRVVEHAAVPRSNAEMEVFLAGHVGERAAPGPWWAVRAAAPLVHAPGSPPWSFGRRPSYVASPHPSSPEDVETCTDELVLAVVRAFGPMSRADLFQFLMVSQVRVLAPALERLRDRLVEVRGPRGPLVDVPDGVLAADADAPARLLPMWDEVLLAYKDRSRTVPEPYRRLVLRSNGDSLPTVLVDGYVAGVWRPVDDGIEVTAFEELPDSAWDEIEAEVVALQAFLAPREPGAYRRYGRWWVGLPAATVRVLPPG